MEHFLNNFYVYTDLVPTDIYPIQYGEEQCESNHAFGPCIRKNYLVHYVYEGKGILRTEHGEYPVEKGQMFLIAPGQLTYYQADGKQPWLYRWMEFNGSMVPQILKKSGLSVEIPIFVDDSQGRVGDVLLDIVETGDMQFEILMHKFWKFISCMVKYKNNVVATNDYIDKAESFIKINIHKRVTVEDVAGYVGINRSHLSRLFKQYKGVSPQQYIISMKMNSAAHYLKNKKLSVGEVAQSVGYVDSHVFNKTFHKYFNVSPSEWRQKEDWEQFIVDGEEGEIKKIFD